MANAAHISLLARVIDVTFCIALKPQSVFMTIKGYTYTFTHAHIHMYICMSIKNYTHAGIRGLKNTKDPRADDIAAELLKASGGELL